MLAFIVLDNVFTSFKDKQIQNEVKLIDSIKLIAVTSGFLIPKNDPFFYNISQILTDLESECKENGMEATAIKLNEANKLLMATNEGSDPSSLVKEAEVFLRTLIPNNRLSSKTVSSATIPSTFPSPQPKTRPSTF